MRKGVLRVRWLLSVPLMMTYLIAINCVGGTATAAETPKRGGTLSISHPMPVSVGYPADLRSQGDLDLTPITVDNLLRFDEAGKPLPWLATSWKYSADLKSLTLTLRKGVKFHDGTDFNAAAVKTNLDLYMKAKRGELASVSSVDVIDNYTVKLNLSSVDAYLLNNFGEAVGMIISPAALAKGADWCRTNPVGTGPFRQVKFTSGVSVRYERWDGFWQKGKPYLDAIEVINIPQEMTTLAAFKKGEIQNFVTRDPAIVKDLKDATLYTNPAYLVLAPDSAHKDSPLSDINVRKAIAYAIDSPTIQNAVSTGLFKVSNQFVDKSTVFYNPDVVGYPYNLQKAKELLASSRFPNGFKMDITFPPTFGSDAQLAAVQYMLSKINIEVNLKKIGPAAVIQARTDGWKNGCLALAIGCPPEKDPGRVLSILFAKDQAAAGYFSVTARSEKYDALLSSVVHELDFEKRTALNQKLIKQIIDEDCMFFIIYNAGKIYPTASKLKDSRIGEFWSHQWTPEDAWFDK